MIFIFSKLWVSQNYSMKKTIQHDRACFFFVSIHQWEHGFDECCLFGQRTRHVVDIVDYPDGGQSIRGQSSKPIVAKIAIPMGKRHDQSGDRQKLCLQTVARSRAPCLLVKDVRGARDEQRRNQKFPQWHRPTTKKEILSSQTEFHFWQTNRR